MEDRQAESVATRTRRWRTMGRTFRTMSTQTLMPMHVHIDSTTRIHCRNNGRESGSPVSPFSSLGGFPDSRFPIRRESGKRESPFPDSESAGTGNRGHGGGGPGISSVVWGVASAVAYLTASARTLTRAGRLPGQCQLVAPAEPRRPVRLGFILPMYYYLLLLGSLLRANGSLCRRTDSDSDSERAHCQEREFPQHWPP